MKHKLYRLVLGDKLITCSKDIAGSFRSVNELLETVKTPSIVFLDGLNPEEEKNRNAVCQAMWQLRQSAVYYAAPIYFAKSMGNLDILADGVGIANDDIFLDAAEILSRMDHLSLEKNAANQDLRLLTFLYCRRDGYTLSPAAFAASPWIYEYPKAFVLGGFKAVQSAFPFGPVANALTTGMQSSAEWLGALSAQGLLANLELVDRIRLCPYCHTGNLNYIDFCPACGSIDFAKKEMIHCFTCGYVAPEENFRNGMLLQCPRCNVTLRHIGSDYDRPVETYSCNQCGERFIEPEVKADCLQCRKKSATEDLEVRQIYKYGITAKGKRAVQLGQIDFSFSLFDSNRNVLPLYFYQVTDWLLQMKLRYSDEDFCLLYIKVAGIEAMESHSGISRFKNLIDELARRIRELVRVTDITTSTGANTFWVLLPRTGQKGGEILASRIEKLAELVSMENGAHVHIQVKCVALSAEYAGRGPVAERLLGEYEAALLNKR